jgi:rRNA-processing protein FCF1
VAKKYNAMLITDDEPMAMHAKHLGIDTILIREVSVEELKSKIDELN